jgi:hypothetical protein
VGTYEELRRCAQVDRLIRGFPDDALRIRVGGKDLTDGWYGQLGTRQMSLHDPENMLCPTYNNALC